MRILFLLYLLYFFFGWFVIKLPDEIRFIASFAILFVFFCIFFSKIRLVKNKKLEYLVIAGVYIVMFEMFLFGRFYEMSFLYLCILSPAMILLMAKSIMDDGLYRQLTFFFTVLFVVNALVSYYERATGTFLFYEGPILWESTENEELSVLIFRSPALLGHPLQNAMIMAYFMVIILMLPIKIMKKLLLWMVGFISLFCFNARGSILASIFFFVWYMFFFQKTKNRLLKYAGLGILSAVFIAFIIFLLTTPLAGRLISGDIYEGNGEERIRIWYVLGGMDFVDFLLGLTSDKYIAIAKSLQLETAESWLALFIIRMGLPVTVFFVTVYSKIIWELMPNVKKNHRLFIMLSFFVFASMNNSLAIAATPLVVILLTAPVFNTYYITRVSE